MPKKFRGHAPLKHYAIDVYWALEKRSGRRTDNDTRNLLPLILRKSLIRRLDQLLLERQLPLNQVLFAAHRSAILASDVPGGDYGLPNDSFKGYQKAIRAELCHLIENPEAMEAAVAVDLLQGMDGDE